MRFNDRLTFVKQTESRYDPIEGRVIEGEPIKDTVPCNLSTMGIDRTNELFGQVDKVVTVARVQRPYNKTFDYIMIDSQKYEMKRQSSYRKGVYYLERVSNG